MSAIVLIIASAAAGILALFGYALDFNWTFANAAILGGIWFGLLFCFLTPFRMWKTQKDEIDRLTIIRHQESLLTQIGQLRGQIVNLRVFMEADQQGIEGDRWEREYNALHDQITKTIREHAGAAEAGLYTNVGNMTRRVGPNLPPHQLYIDHCIRDNDYLGEYIRDFSRGRERHGAR